MEVLLRMQTQMAEAHKQAAEANARAIAADARMIATDARIARMELEHAQALKAAAIQARIDGSTMEGLNAATIEEEAMDIDQGDESKQQQRQQQEAGALATLQLEKALQADARSLTAAAAAAIAAAKVAPPSGSSGMHTPMPGSGTAGATLFAARGPLATPLSQQPSWTATRSTQPAAARNLQLPAQSGASSSGGAQGAAASSSHSGAVPKGLEPRVLEESEARKPGVLEDWIFGVERAMEAMGLEQAAFADQLRFAKRYWDRLVTHWWMGYEPLLRAQGTPVLDWPGFTNALRSIYTPIADEDTAVSKLFALRMQSGESMPAYVARASELFHRTTRGRVPSHIAAERLQDGVEESRFPFAVRELKEKQQLHRAVHAGTGVSFEMVTAFLQLAAAREPAQKGAAAHASTTSNHRAAAPQGGGGGGNRARIAQITRVLQELQAEDEREEEHSGGTAASAQRVAPIRAEGAAPTGKCNKCGESGHMAWQCTSSKELRSCFGCGKVGHVKGACPERNKASGAANKQSKNE